MISILFGKDGFTAKEALASIQSELNEDGMLADNTTTFDGAKVKPGELLAACQTIPFLGAHRLIVVGGLLRRFEATRRGRKKQSKGPDVGIWDPLIEALPDLPETTTLVFLEPELRPQNALLKALRKHAKVEEFKPLAQGQLGAWITDRAERFGAALDARAVASMAQLVGNDLWTLEAELRKLAVYAGDRQVTEADVRSMVSLAREPSVFAMADAVVEGRMRDAADLMQRLLADGESPLRLLSTIARQYRLLLLTKELLDQRVRPPEIIKKLGVQSFVMQRLMKQAPGYELPQLRQAYHLLIEADLSVKRGIHDDQTALQLLIFELAAQRRDHAPTQERGRPDYSRPPAGRGPAPSAAAQG